MRPQSQLTKGMHVWIQKSTGWFSHFGIDSAMGIKSKKDKTLRRVTLKRLCDKGLLIRADTRQGVYRRFIPAKKIDWNNPD